MSSFKEMIEVKLAQKLVQHPSVMRSADVKDRCIAIEIEGLGAWSFWFDPQGDVKMEKGVSPDNHCLVQTNEKTFEGMIKGNVNVPLAYMMRKIKIKGDLNLAIKVGLGIQKAVEEKG
jgi:putative sterol carrier protein